MNSPAFQPAMKYGGYCIVHIDLDGGFAGIQDNLISGNILTFYVKDIFAALKYKVFGLCRE